MLKQAREEAMDGGNAGEKSAIFQKYKDQINDYLNSHGHDVAKAYKDWEARQQAANKSQDESRHQRDGTGEIVPARIRTPVAG